MYATIWYAGIVILSMGYQGMTDQECHSLTTVMRNDIHDAYVENNNEPINGYEKQYFEVTCENENLFKGE